MKLNILISLLILHCLDTEATDCTNLPTTGFLEIRLENLLAAKGGEGTNPIVTAQDAPHYTCQVQGTSMGTYQELSVVMNYITNTNSNPRIRQFELDCVTVGSSNDWQERSGSLSNVLSGGSFTDYINLGTFTNCSQCNENAGNENHCIACDSSCNVGLMRCTGSTNSDCCLAFETDGQCRTDLNCTQENFVAIEQNNFTCACGLSCEDGYTLNTTDCTCSLSNICMADNPCANNGVCTLGSSPNQYTCNCTGTNYNGTNCTECALICNDGYTADSACVNCQLDDICVADNPCANNGVCTLGSSPDQYTCDCAGTNYMGTNCTVCSLPCNKGYSVDSSCTSCQLDDICIADNPCNNGVCTLGSSPDQYTCNCTGTNYIGTNCSNCSLVCSKGYAADSNCVVCELADICQANNPCVNGECRLGSSPDEYSCVCTGTNFIGENCSICPLTCDDDGYAPNNICSQCQLDDICVADNPCANNGVCTLGSSPDQYTCDCASTNYIGTNCTVCSKSCSDGFAVDSTCTVCQLADICVVNNPCTNGVCILISSPDNYTCNCTGTNYNGPYCSECALTCNDGYIADGTCTVCQLDDICVADNPCANNGVCTLGSSPDQYTCDCAGTNYMGTNCTVCGLQCSNGGTVDSTCTSCMCSPMYTGVLCDTEVNYCTDDIDCGQYGSCINDHEQMTYKCSCNEGWTGSSCADCTVSNCIDCTGSPPVCERCDNDYIISSGTCVAKVDPCTSVPCSNDGTCRSSTDGTYECACTEAWTGVHCTECASGYGTRNTSEVVICVPCDIDNCRDCIRNYLDCAECADGYSFNSERTSCVLNERDRRLLTGIIIGSVLVGLLLMLFIVLVVVRATNHTHFNRYKRNTEKRKVVSNNPLYEETQLTQI